MHDTSDEKKLYIEIGETIKRCRNKKRLTQAKLADTASIKRTSLTNIENGNQNPPIHILYRISSALEIDITDLLPKKIDTSLRITKVESVRIGTRKVMLPKDVVSVIEKINSENN